MRYVAYTVKGIEKIAKRELQEKFDDITILEISDKIIVFEYTGDIDQLSKIRTIDDIGLFVCHLDVLDFKNLRSVIEYLKEVREIKDNFSLTTSISRVDINKDTLNEEIVSKLTSQNLTYTPSDRTNLDFRIFLNDKIGLITIRLFSIPLGNKAYEVDNYIGALKPTIAAAMVKLATENITAHSRIVDNFCGSGTILCESYVKGYSVYGGDINSKAVTITQKRLKLLGNTQTDNLKVQDATKTKWNNNYFDIGISNLPWDKQHKAESITDLYVDSLREYRRILKLNYKLCIICHKPELLIKHIKKEFSDSKIEKIDIGYLGQTPSIVTASNY